MSLKFLEDHLHINAQIFHEFLRQREICAKCFPYSLMDELILP
jgi:hypothetical protein